MSKILRPFILLMLITGTSLQAQMSYTCPNPTTTPFVTILGTGESTGLAYNVQNNDDAQTAAIDLDLISAGFRFYLSGSTTAYRYMGLSVNGWAWFSATGGWAAHNYSSLSSPSFSTWVNNYTNIRDAATFTYKPLLACFWDDLTLTSAGNSKVLYKITGASPNRILTLEWNKVQRYPDFTGNGAASFQIIIRENPLGGTNASLISYNYYNEGTFSSAISASIGILGTCPGDFYSLNSSGAAPVASQTVETSTISSFAANNQLYRFTGSVAASATNDLLCSAAPLTFNTNSTCNTVVGTTKGATAEAFTVTGGGAGGACLSTPSGRDVWYTVTKPLNTTTMLVSTDNVLAGGSVCSSGGVQFQIYTNLSICSSPILTEISGGCSNDGGILNPKNSSLFLTGLPAAATNYVIRVSGDADAQLDFQICVSNGTNDNVCGAIDLGVTPGNPPGTTCISFPATTLRSTKTRGVASPGTTYLLNQTANNFQNQTGTTAALPDTGLTSTATPNDIWFKFRTSATNTDYVIDTYSGSLTDAQMAIYAGILSCVTNPPSSSSTFFRTGTPNVATSTFSTFKSFTDDKSAVDFMPRIIATNLAVNTTYYVRVWRKNLITPIATYPLLTGASSVGNIITCASTTGLQVGLVLNNPSAGTGSFNTLTLANASSATTTITCTSTTGLQPGMMLAVTAGTGAFAATGAAVVSVLNAIQFTVAVAPATALVGATILATANYPSTTVTSVLNATQFSVSTNPLTALFAASIQTSQVEGTFSICVYERPTCGVKATCPATAPFLPTTFAYNPNGNFNATKCTTPIALPNDTNGVCYTNAPKIPTIGTNFAPLCGDNYKGPSANYQVNATGITAGSTTMTLNTGYTTANISIGGLVYVTAGSSGIIPANCVVTSIISLTQFTISTGPTLGVPALNFITITSDCPINNSINTFGLATASAVSAPNITNPMFYRVKNNLAGNLTFNFSNILSPNNNGIRAALYQLNVGGANPTSPNYTCTASYVSAAGATSVINTITVASTTNLAVGMVVSVLSGTGTFAANTTVTTITPPSTFTVSTAPTIALSGGATVVIGVGATWSLYSTGLSVTNLNGTFTAPTVKLYGNIQSVAAGYNTAANTGPNNTDKFSMTYTGLPIGVYYLMVDAASGDRAYFDLSLTGTSATGNGVLPINLLNFTGKNAGGINTLRWTTSSEVNNDFFTLERSFNGEIFEPIAQIDGAGNSNHTINYSYIDKNTSVGITYYRLKQTDFNKNESYSEIVALYSKTGKVLEFSSLRPNPTNENFFIDLVSYDNSVLDFAIRDISGKVVKQYFATVNQGENTIESSLDGLQSGLYFVNVRDTKSGDSFMKKVVKQ